MPLNDNDIELQEIKNQKIAENALAASVANWVDTVAFTTLLTTFLQESLHVFLEETLKYILFPAIAGANVVNSILAWRDAKLARRENGEMKSWNIANALVETAAAAMVVIAIAGTLIASTLFSLATPILFAVQAGGKTLFNFGKALWEVKKALTITPKEGESEDEVKTRKEKYYGKARVFGIRAFAGALATLAITLVFVYGKVVYAPLGIVAGSFCDSLDCGRRCWGLSCRKT